MAPALWGFLLVEVRMSEDNIIPSLLSEIASLLKEFPAALERQAGNILQSGKDPELAAKLAKGADAMRDSGNIYLSWARHFASLSEGQSGAAEEEDESDFGM
jgi:hypothetical protein